MDLAGGKERELGSHLNQNGPMRRGKPLAGRESHPLHQRRQLFERTQRHVLGGLHEGDGNLTEDVVGTIRSPPRGRLL